MASDTIRRNRAAWDEWSDGYQRRHGPLLRGDQAAAWGLWRVPEDELRLLGPVAGQMVLELGCGAAHWSAQLAGLGATVVGLDNSAAQLAHARGNTGDRGIRGLVQGAAEALPFRSASFDLVFSDYGGMSWADPVRSVPEVARVLRDGGRLVFCTSSPLFVVCLDPDTGELGTRLRRDYFGLRTREVAGVATDYQLPYGEWIALFAASGLTVERLVEVEPPVDAVTTFRDRPLDWARRWPAENIWRVRKS